jgi:DNA-binding CsgD family transcriptional regulator
VVRQTVHSWLRRYAEEGPVARGRTNPQIAAELHISVRTVGSYLDRIRDKTGCRRRADLTRLALNVGLV